MAEETNTLRFQLFGAFEVWDGDTRIKVGGKYATRLLAALLVDAGRVVSIDSLVDAVWGEDAPQTASHQVRKLTADLRRKIPGGKELIITDGPGYRIHANNISIDYKEFDTNLHAARHHTKTDPLQAITAFRTALNLWEPILLDGEVFESLNTLGKSRCDAAAEEYYALRVAHEPPAEVIADLDHAVQREPLREHLRGQLMTALFAAGRQAEALEQCEKCRATLADELGVDPGPALRAVHSAILIGDHAALGITIAEPPKVVAVNNARNGTSHPDRAGHADHPDDTEADDTTTEEDTDGKPLSLLPRTVNDFIGRERELGILLSALRAEEHGAGKVVVVTALGGSGKTTLAVRAAHAVRDSFTDGVLFADMGANRDGYHSTIDSVLEKFFAVLEVSADKIPQSLPARIDLWRSVTADRELLLVLDDVADAETVRSLLPASQRSLTIVTSRSRMAELDDAIEIPLGEMHDNDGLAMMRKVVGERKVAAEPEAVRKLVQCCGGSPLALRLVSKRLLRDPDQSIEELVWLLEDERDRLREMRVGSVSMGSTLRLTHRGLSEELQHTHAALARFPGSKSFSSHAAAAWLGVPRRQAVEQLNALVDVHFLEPSGANAYTMHDLVCAFSLEDGPEFSDADAEQAFARLVDYLHAGSHLAADIQNPGRRKLDALAPPTGPELPRIETERQAESWFYQHDEVLRSTLAAMKAEEQNLALVSMARNFTVPLMQQGRCVEGVRIGEKAARAARVTSIASLEAITLMNLANFQWRAGQLAAVTTLEECLKAQEKIGEPEWRGSVLAHAAAINVDIGQVRTSRKQLELALELVPADAKRQRSQLMSLLAYVSLYTGRIDETQSALIRSEELDGVHRQLAGTRMLTSALVHVHRQEWQAMLDTAQRAAQHYGDKFGADQFTLATSMVAWGSAVQGQQELFQQAEKTVQEKIASARPSWQAQARNFLGFANYALGRTVVALDHQTQSLSQSKIADNEMLQAFAHQGMAMCCEALGQPEVALGYKVSSQAVLEAMGVIAPWHDFLTMSLGPAKSAKAVLPTDQ